MKRFTTACVDIVTRMQMVLSECSFNAACMFLDMENADKKFGELIAVRSLGLLEGKTEFKYEKSRFIYDENRGYLLKA